MTSPQSPADAIRALPMSLYQYVVVAVCMFTYAADGVDVVALSYAAPGMIREWGISPEVFGLASSATPVGIAAGSFLVAPLADRIGRRVLMLWLLAALTTLMLLTAQSATLYQLVALRLVTGLALGSLVVCLNVTVSEVSSTARSSLLVGILHTGYSLGSMVCGALAALLVEPHGWRSLFFAAGLLNATSLALALVFLAESPSYLVARQPKRALERLNLLMRRMRKPVFDMLPPPPPGLTKAGRAPLPRALWLGAALLCLAGFVFTISGGFMSAWRPHVLASAGMTMSWNGIAGIVTSAAGVIAHLTVGALARSVGETRIAVIFFCVMAVCFTILGAVPNGALLPLTAAAAASGFFNVGAFTAMTLVTLKHFHPAQRNTGLGLMLGCSRLGGIAGPLLGGVLIGAGLDRLWVMLVFSLILAVPVAAVLYARTRTAGVN